MTHADVIPEPSKLPVDNYAECIVGANSHSGELFLGRVLSFRFLPDEN
jgi:hypothetical protein